MSFKASQIAQLTGAKLIGEDAEIFGVCGAEESGENCLAWAEDLKKYEKALTTSAKVIITDFKIAGTDGGKAPRNKTLLLTDNPRLAFAKAANLFAPKPKLTGIHESASFAPSAKLGKGVAIGANVVISENARIGDNVKIYAGVYIGEDSKIGNDTVIYPNVSIMDRVTIGDRVIIHSGSVIGSEGFGYVKEGVKHFKIPQLGAVSVGDDAEIGSNVCIDRSTTGVTRIGRGTKIDNLVHIAHNVSVGEDCIIVAMTGIAGSSKVGDRAVIAAQVGVKDHVNIGEDAFVLGRSGVTKDIPPKSMVSGYPAKPHREELKYQSFLSMLPKTIDELKKRIGDLEKDE